MGRGHVQVSRRGQAWDMPAGCQNGPLEDHIHPDPQRVQVSSNREKGADTIISPWLSSLRGAGSEKQRSLESGCLDLAPLAPVQCLPAP